jgi:hypothetical protein
MLTEEGEKAGTGRPKILNWLRFKTVERQKLRLEVSFPPRFLIASDEQPIHAIELENSS